MHTRSGELVEKQGKGTLQGGVISPLLANLFLHYVLDKWLEQTDKTVKFARYADDVILHCGSKAHAEQTLNKISERMASCGLELHPAKTKIVYCRDSRRRGKYSVVNSTFWVTLSSLGQANPNKQESCFLDTIVP